ncbi:potassium-transporting ATPase B chain [Methanocella paludicola SANAE]|uniref:Potassium-transporting ATPase ATP-binding subunit n=1 Tax=Methanocella paludicola (strain DSM 17711 / JCM 13418 / NBRC 101707 / SANAE) TaxID=304371 RepID=D1Z018_METPS|nr:potassium-transporting ATPase subunit KdpB [Methanocella paludicola]BAI62040.1 potassium-transporting ATPase B chain [Methanocella paludicola SANAE]
MSQKVSWMSGQILWGSLKDSLLKFDPRYTVKNPVMFILYLCLAVTLLIAAFPAEFSDVAGGSLTRVDYVAISAILFLTMWFSFFSEALAEAQGKAQADSLKKMKTETRARLLKDGTTLEVNSDMLKAGDMIMIQAGDIVPDDGSIEKGAVMLDESMMTGESQLVLRESGGDKSSVLGGTRVASGEAIVKVTADPGETFLDRMIRLVEGAERQKTPNELALTVVLISLTIALLVVVVAIVPLARFYSISVDTGSLITLLVCLMPTTIGGLLPAIGVAGINRVTGINVVAKSGKAVETAGDIDVLILDKTGTLTMGNRYASQFIPAPGKSMDELAAVAMYASAMDDTPEGRSVISFGKKLGYNIDEGRLEGSQAILFTPETRVSGTRMKDGLTYIKGSVDAVGTKCGRIPEPVRLQAENASRGGSTPLAVASDGDIVGLIVLKDLVKPGIKDRLAELRRIGIRTVMCTGDNRLTAAAIARETGVDDYVANAIPEDKLSIIKKEQALGKLVAMTGDGTNDAPALAQADVGLAMNSGTSAAKEAANMVDLDSDPTKLIEVVTIGKQLLITRGALTTFSVTNDVAKYFAILPAILASSIPAISLLNVMGLASPRSAIYSALIFNALAIPLLIPVAINGVKYRPVSASAMLRRNLLVYGAGGLVSSFIGIKLIDIIISGWGII